MILEERGLFGGGMIVKVPKDYKDVSQFRQVPDNQEVFVSNDSDETLIVELLETPEEAQEKNQGINFHWNELCTETGSIESKIDSEGSLNINEFENVPYIIGLQSIPKFGKLKDTLPVKIRLLCLRIPSISTDILISCSSPIDSECFTDESFKEISNREDFKKQKILDEARKAGKAPALLDEEGQVINPHIPEYIVKAPWYINTGGPSLKHQRSTNKVETSSTAHQIKGILETDQVITKFRKGACENCGAMTHKTKECVDRPRKVGAKFTGIDLKPDEFLVEGPQDFDGKRDRWASYDSREYDEVVQTFEKIEEERRKFKENEAERDLKKGIATELESEAKDEEKYAEAVDMPGQKVDTKTRMTVRNLRIREDTAKYLRNLDIDSAYYDPKTRSMRENPNQDENPEDLTYAGDNFIRSSGDSNKVTELQVFAWQAYERGEDISLQANPSEVERLYKEHTKKKDQEKRKLEESLLSRYGNQDDLLEENHGEGLNVDESDVYIEYSKTAPPLQTPSLMFLSIDVGTSWTKCFLYNEKGLLIKSSSIENSLIKLENGAVEQSPTELFSNVTKCLENLNTFSKTQNVKIFACGITNQRESVMPVNKSTGEPLGNLISWMDVRSADLVEQFKSDFSTCECFEASTGLKASTFFSAFKIQWILQNNTKLGSMEELGFCTVNTWILWNLTKEKSFFTDPSNASRMFLYDLKYKNWSNEILKYFNFKTSWFPEVRNCDFGSISDDFPFGGTEITAMIGDQQASLIGHWGNDLVGKSKCTFGTGAFILRHIDKNEAMSCFNKNSLKTVLYGDHLVEEFPIISAGSLIKWLQNSMCMIDDLNDLQELDFNPLERNSSVYFIPNLSGCLFPAWDSSARGSFHNISLKSSKQDFIVSVFESLAFSVRRAIENVNMSVLSIDGGMSQNEKFCQLLANICNCPIRVLDNPDATGLGCAILASNFLIKNEPSQFQIIRPNPDLHQIYLHKYSHWISLH